MCQSGGPINQIRPLVESSAACCSYLVWAGAIAERNFVRGTLWKVKLRSPPARPPAASERKINPRAHLAPFLTSMTPRCARDCFLPSSLPLHRAACPFTVRCEMLVCGFHSICSVLILCRVDFCCVIWLECESTASAKINHTIGSWQKAKSMNFSFSLLKIRYLHSLWYLQLAWNLFDFLACILRKKLI